MSDPVKYTRDYSFTDYQASNPSAPLPGLQVDAELEDVETSIDEIVDAIKDVRRSDGALKNGIVTVDSLSAQVAAGVGTGALASATAAAASADAASDSAVAAAASATAASGSATSASGYASNALTSRNEASGFSDDSAAAAALAETARDFANKWATEAEDVDVDDGVNPVGKSAYHWAQAAQGLVIGAIPDGAITTAKIADGAVTTVKINSVASRTTGQCRLEYVSATGIKLSPHKGNQLSIDGVSRTIPSIGVSLTNSGASANTKYNVYAYWTGSAIALALDTTATAANSDGWTVKDAAADYTFVGVVWTNSSSQFFANAGVPALQSHFNRQNYIRTEEPFFGPVGGLGYTVPDGVGDGTTFAWLTGITASTIANFLAGGVNRLSSAKFRVVAGASNSANKIRLVRYDDGPVNIVEIAVWTSTGLGGVENVTVDVTSELNAIIEAGTTRNLGMQVTKLAATTLSIYKVHLELAWEIE